MTKPPLFIGRNFTLSIKDAHGEMVPVGDSHPAPFPVGDFEFTGTFNPDLPGAEFMAALQSLQDQATAEHVRRINAETEWRLAAALTENPANRLWRSDAELKDDADGFRYVYQFQVLPPGAFPPGSGQIFGPQS
jgi:hypothetical protein